MNAPPSRRKAIVFVSLVGVLTATSALLLALCPAPLRPEASATLFNAESTPADAMAAIFQTDRPIRAGRWTSILIRHSKTAAGDAQTLSRGKLGLGDHFVLCNGDGGADGEIQLGTRWTEQTPAAAPKGTSAIDPKCISICLIGDFNRIAPTAAQMRRSEQLVAALQDRLDIPASRVYCAPTDPTAAGIGRAFPIDEFRSQLAK